MNTTPQPVSSIPMSDASESRRSPAKLVLLGGVLVATGMAAYVFDVRAWLQQLLAFVEGLGAWGPALFVASYAILAVFFVPASILTIGAGTLFGVFWGTVWVSAGSTVGATLAFLVGRHFARDWVAQKIDGNAKFSAIDRAVEKEGWKIVALTRLSPIFPYNLLNYLFSLTKVKLSHFVLASWLGMIPGTVMWVYLGAIGKAVAESSERTPAQTAMFGVGLLATIVVTVYVTKVARRALNTRVEKRI